MSIFRGMAEDVMVAGKLLKEPGVLKLDTAEIVRNARTRAEGILKKGKGTTKLVF